MPETPPGHLSHRPFIKHRIKSQLRAHRWEYGSWWQKHRCKYCDTEDEFRMLHSNGRGLLHEETYVSADTYRRRNNCAACGADICRSHTAWPSSAFFSAHTFCTPCFALSPQSTTCGVAGRNATYMTLQEGSQAIRNWRQSLFECGQHCPHLICQSCWDRFRGGASAWRTASH